MYDMPQIGVGQNFFLIQISIKDWGDTGTMSETQ